MSTRKGWHYLEKVEYDEKGTIESYFKVNEDSLWFSGHFPNEPILPGIAQLSMVFDTLAHVQKEKGHSIQLHELRRIKFRKPVRTNEKIMVSINPNVKDDNEYSFTVSSDNGVASNGIIWTREKTL